MLGVEGKRLSFRKECNWFCGESNQLITAKASLGCCEYLVIARKEPPLLPSPPGVRATRQRPFVAGPPCIRYLRSQTAPTKAASEPVVMEAFQSVAGGAAMAGLRPN